MSAMGSNGNEGVTFFFPIARSYFRSVLTDVGQSIFGTTLLDGLASLLEASDSTYFFCEDIAKEVSESRVVAEYFCNSSLYLSFS